MSEDTKFAVYRENETVTDSIYKDVVTGIMVSFCVYISNGSTWWTFVTGLMFLFFLFGVMSRLFKRTNRFKTKAELMEWVNGLPDDPSPKS